MSSAVPFEDLPLIDQARWLRRHEPTKAVAFALKRSDGTDVARMFFTPGRLDGIDSLDAETRAALLKWAAMIHEDRAVIGGGR